MLLDALTASVSTVSSQSIHISACTRISWYLFNVATQPLPTCAAFGLVSEPLMGLLPNKSRSNTKQCIRQG